jgi:branched-chain amino acid transport system ATP-binding protein
MALLDMSDIHAGYGGANILNGVAIAIDAHEIGVIVGPNGAGKSTTLKAISNLLSLEDGAVTSGSISFDGKPVLADTPHGLVRRGLFHVMEGRRIFEDLTVEENLTAATFALSGRGVKPPSFDLVYGYFPRLYERRTGRAGYLSGGEQQMLAIGRALIAQPKLILLDEPSLGLSPILVEEIFGIIARINRETGVSMLLVEQNAAVAFAIAHYGYIMETGKIVLDGPTERLVSDQDVREFYLGMSGGEEAKSYRDVKHYKRRKRWLS